MSFKGDLSTIGLAEVFQMISMSQKEGTLVVQDADSRKSIYFGATGVRLVSTGKRKGLRLGDMLLRAGKIGENELQDALENAKIQKKMLGEVLVENGYLGEGEIEEVIRAQIEEEIYDLFLWKRANYEFIEGPPPDDLAGGPDARVTQLSFDVNGLLLEAVRRADEWGVINQKIPSLDSVFVFASESDRNEEDKEASDGARRVYRLIDGQTSCNDIVQNTGVSEFDVCKVLTDLVDRGRIRLLTAEELMGVAEKRLVDGNRTQALRMYQAAAAQVPDDPKVVASIARVLENQGENRPAAASHLRAGRIYLETGDLDRALDHLQRAAGLDPDNLDVKFGMFEAHAADGNLNEGKRIAKELVAHCWTAQDYERARGLCDRILYADPEVMEFRVWRARLLHQMRDKDALREDLDYIKKHLPADAQEREKIEVLLREIEGRPSSAPVASRPKTTVVPTRRKRRRKGVVVAVAVLVLLLGSAAFLAKLEFDAREELDSVLAVARSHDEKQEFVDARRAVDAFLESGWRWSPMQAGRARDYLRGLETKQQNAMKEREARLGRERQELLDRIESLRQSIESTRQRNPSEALKQARAMRDLAVKAKETELITQAETFAKELERFIADAFQLKLRAEALEKEGKVRDAALLIDRLLINYPNTEAARGALYPLEIASQPAGVRVTSDRSGVVLGETTGAPLLIRMKPGEVVRLRFEKKGYGSLRRDVKDKTLGRMTVELTEKKALWSMPLGFSVSGEAVLLDDMLFVGGSSRLYALRLSPTGGRFLWSEQLEGNIQGAPQVGNRRAFVGTDRGWLYCIDPSRTDARVVWKKSLGGRILSEASLSSAGDRLYVGTTGRTLHSVDTKSGEGVWTRGLPGEAMTAPVVAGRTIFVGCSDGTILALNGPGPEGEVWRFRVEPSPGPMVLADTTLYVPAGPYLYALNALEGKRVWKRLLSPGVRGRVTRQGDRVVAATGGGKVQFLDAATGDSLGAFDADGPVQGGVVGAGPLVLFGVEKGKFTALDAGRTTMRWEFTSEGRVRAACTPGGGLVYLCSGGSLFAIELN